MLIPPWSCRLFERDATRRLAGARERLEWRGDGVYGCCGRDCIAQGARERLEWRGDGVCGCCGRDCIAQGARERLEWRGDGPSGPWARRT